MPAGTPQQYHIDFRGNTITIGDCVLYAALSGRSCQVVEATVLAILDKGPKQYGSGDEIKFQLLGTGRSSRWAQQGTVAWDRTTKSYETVDRRPVWVMAENVVKTS